MTPDKSKILDLANRVEKLEGPNYATEHEVGALLGLPDECRTPPYTYSIDAALSVVPVGWNWTLDGLDVLNGRPHGAYALLGLPGQLEAQARAKTPALALLSASLRARAAMGEK